MGLVYELVVKEDLDIGTGSVARTNPGGGQMQGTQINLGSFAFARLSQAWTPGTIPANSTTAVLTISAKGVSAGDFVLASLNTLQQAAAILYAEATTDAVNVYITNPTAFPLTVTAGTLKALVFKTP